MLKLAALPEEHLTEKDKQYGYAFGCAGVWSMAKSAKYAAVGISALWNWAREGKIRVGRTGKVCRRSLVTYIHSLEGLEK